MKDYKNEVDNRGGAGADKGRPLSKVIKESKRLIKKLYRKEGHCEHPKTCK